MHRRRDRTPQRHPIVSKLASIWLRRSRVSAVILLASAASISTALTDWERAGTESASLQSGLRGFEQNQGQADANTAFLFRGDGYQLHLESEASGIELRSWVRDASRGVNALRLSYLGTHANRIDGVEALAERVHYLVGNRRDGWLTNVPTFAAVRYTALYPGVDLIVRAREHDVEYTFVVSPGASPEAVRLAVEGGELLQSDAALAEIASGDAGAKLRGLQPRAYQEEEGAVRIVEAELNLAGSQLAFQVPSYDVARPLFLQLRLHLEPQLTGEISSDEARVAVDAQGNIFVAGRVPAGFGEPGAAFVSELNADDLKPIYTTYFGGEGEDIPLGIAVAASGEVLLTGRTTSISFPTERALRSELQGRADAFVSRLTSDGAGFVFSTYLGGESDDEGRALVVDSHGGAWLTGRTESAGFPVTAGALQAKLGGLSDAFVCQLNADGSQLLYASFLGGGGIDESNAIELGGAGEVHVAGTTRSKDFPLAQPLTSAARDAAEPETSDAFIATLSSAGDQLVFSTRLGGSADDSIAGLAVDAAGDIYVAGSTNSVDFANSDWTGQRALGVIASHPQRDAFVAKFDPKGDRLVYARQLGGTCSDEATGVAVDRSGAPWIVGSTCSSGFPGADADQARVAGKRAAFVTQLDPADGAIRNSTLIGSAQDHLASGVVVTPRAQAVAVGIAHSLESSSATSVQPAFSGGDVFVSLVSESNRSAKAPDSAGCPGTINFDNSAGTGLWQTATNWDLDRLPLSSDDVCINGFNVTHSAGTDTVNSLTVIGVSSLTLSAGTINLSTTSQIDGSFFMSGSGTLGGSGQLTVTGATSLTGGTMTGAARTKTSGGLTIETSGVTLSSGRILENPTGSTATMTATVNLSFNSSASIENAGVWEIQNDADFTDGGGTGTRTITNTGTWRKSGGTATTGIGSTTAFNNTAPGLVEIQSGTLSVSGGTDTGSFTISAGATLQLTGTTTLNSPASVTGAGAVLVTAGTTNFNTGVTFTPTGSTTVSGGTLSFNSGVTLAFTQATTVSGGTLNLGTGSPVSLSALTLSGSGTLGGTDNVTVIGTTTCSGGTMSGTGRTKTSGGLTINTNALTLSSGRILENPTGSTATMTANVTFSFNSPASIENAGVWEIQNDADFTDGGGTGTRTITNTGTWRKSGGTATTGIGSTTAFNNTAPGSVEIQSGTLAVSGGTDTGAFTISAGATLQLTGTNTINSPASVTGAGAVTMSGGTTNFNTGVTFTPTGSTTVSGGTLSFNSGVTLAFTQATTVSGGTLNFVTGSPVSLSALTLSGSGTLGGTDNVTVIGTTTCSGGTISGTGRTKTSGGLTINTNALTLSSGRILENPTGSTATMTANVNLSFNSSASIENAGVWEIPNDADFTDGGGIGTRTITNTGTLRKSGGTATTGIGSTTVFNNTAPGSVEIQSGTLAVSGSADTGVVSISGGAALQLTGTNTFSSPASVTGAGAVTVSAGTTTFNAGISYSTTGLTTVSGGTLNLVTGSPVSLSALTLSGSGTLGGTDNVTVIGATTCTGGTMTGAARAKTSGGLTISTNGVTLTGGRILENPTGSTATMTATVSFPFNGSASIENAGLWEIPNDADFTDGGGTGTRTITNTGTIRKSGGTATTGIGSTTVFNNTAPGSVEIQSGTLSVSGGTDTGAVTISAGATLQLTGTTTLNSPASVTGAGAVLVTAGTTNLNTGVTFTPTGSTTVSGGTLSFNSGVTLTFTQATTVSGGTLNFVTGSPVSLSALTVSGSGTLGGTDEVTVIGATTCSGGTMTGTGRTKTSGGLTINTSLVTLTGGRILENPTGSTATMTANVSFPFNSSASIENAGVWEIPNDADFTDGSGTGTRTITNTGTLRKSGGTAITGIGSTTAFNNTAPGLVEIQSGTLAVSGSTDTGAFTISAGATLQLTGTNTFNSPASVTGAGAVTVSGGTTNFNAGVSYSITGLTTVSGGTLNFVTGSPVSLSALTLSGSGTLGGTDEVTVIGATTCSGGTMTGAARTKASGGLTINTSLVTLTGGRILENLAGSTATMTASVTFPFNNPASIENAGLWEIQNDADFTDGGGAGTRSITNSGTFRKPAGAGTSSCGSPFNNTGTVEVVAGTLQYTRGYTQTAGSTTLNGGTLTSSTTLDIQGGNFTGVGTATANLTSAGHVAPGLSIATLSLTGNYTQTSAGDLNIELGGLTPGTQYDRFAVSGIATLAGTLNVTFVNGFVPVDGNSFTILTFASSTGAFTTLNLPTLDGGAYWLTNYGPTSLTLTVALDSDGDGAPDINDCAPQDPGAFASPAEVKGDRFGSDKRTYSWTSSAPSSGSATVHDVKRGALNEFPVGGGGAETCLASGIVASSITDATVPAASSGFYYLARGRNVCGTGSYGSATDGAQRTTSACP